MVLQLQSGNKCNAPISLHSLMKFHNMRVWMLARMLGHRQVFLIYVEISSHQEEQILVESVALFLFILFRK